MFFAALFFFFAARFSRDRGVKLRINALGSHVVFFLPRPKNELDPNVARLLVSEETEKVEGALSGKATPSFFTPRRERYFPHSNSSTSGQWDCLSK